MPFAYKKFSSLALVSVGLILSLACNSGASLGSTIRGFEQEPGYVQPITTLMGNLQNTGWVTSARVNQGSGWNFSLSIPVGYIGADDHQYDFRYGSHCPAIRARGIACPTDSLTWNNAPTIWGPRDTNRYMVYASALNPSGGNDTIWYVVGGNVRPGDETLRKWVNIPFLIPRFSYSKAHVRGTLAGLFVPSFGVFGGYWMAGLGLQYDFTKFLPPAVGGKEFNLSIATDLNEWHLGYKPNDKMSGELYLDGFATYTKLVAGWRYDFCEVFTDIGYETSSMKAGGHLYDFAAQSGESPNIDPRVSSTGRNGFRMGLSIALHLGVWQPVLGQSYGAQLATTANLIQFGKEGDQ